MKKIIALISVLALILCWMPAAAQAAEPDKESGNVISGKSAAPAVNLRFASATLTLENDLTLTYYVRPAVMEHYSNVHVAFTMNGVTTVVASPTTVNSSGQSGYAYEGVIPRMMNDDIAATIYGTYDGVEYSYTMHYNAAKYCYTMLSTSNDPLLKTLLVDLLNFGTAHQNYMGYKTEDLINAELTDEQTAFSSSYDQNWKSIISMDEPPYSYPPIVFSGVSLLLDNAIVPRFAIKCDDLAGVSLRITVDDDIFWIDSSEWQLVEGYSDRYYVYFKDLKARQLESEMIVQGYLNGKLASKTLHYSVGTYAALYINNSYTTLGRLTCAMMYYGRSAYNYVNS